MIQRDAVLLAGLLQRPEAFEFGFLSGNLLLEQILARQQFIQRRLTALQLRRQLAGFALHGQRTGAGFLAAGDGVAVIADAVGQQEIKMRIADGQTLGGGAILGDEAEADARHQIDGAIRSGKLIVAGIRRSRQ